MRQEKSHSWSVADPPHISSGASIRGEMIDVLLALLPALAVSVYFFGPRALAVVAVTVLSCVLCEFLYRKLRHQSTTVGDCSAVVTGVLLAMCLPVLIPLPLAALGGAFAILVVKQLYGGLGKNFMNPALVGRVFLCSFPAVMTAFQIPGVDHWAGFGAGLDTVTGATPMAFLHGGTIPAEIGLRSLFLGRQGGSLGEVAAFALLLGGGYLVLRGVIRLRVPLCFLGTVAVLTYLFPGGNEPLQWMCYQLLSGGLLLGAIFMATDPVTSPVTGVGQVLYGVGCGGLTVLLRYFGAYPEGVGFAILLMNLTVWVLDRLGRPRRFGEKRRLPRRTQKEARG